MRIGQINNSINFSRAIPLKTKNNKKNPAQNSKLYSEICDIVNGKPSKTYSKEDCQKIKDFFYDVLGDCCADNPVFVEKSINGGSVLLSGKDASDIRFFKEKAHKNMLEYKKNDGISYATKVELINKADDTVKKSIQYKAENGVNGKHDSSIVLQPYKGADKKQHLKISYLSSLSYFITPKYKEEDENSYCRYSNAYCDYRETEI